MAGPGGRGGGGTPSSSIDAGEVVYTFDVEGSEDLGGAMAQNVELTNELIENLETLDERYSQTAEQGKEKFGALEMAAAGFFGFMYGNAESAQSAFGAVGTALGTIVDALSVSFIPLITEAVDLLTNTASHIMSVTTGAQNMEEAFANVGELIGEGLEWTVETAFKFTFDFFTEGLDSMNEGIRSALEDSWLPGWFIGPLITGSIATYMGRRIGGGVAGRGAKSVSGIKELVPGMSRLSDEAIQKWSRRGGKAGVAIGLGAWMYGEMDNAAASGGRGGGTASAATPTQGGGGGGGGGGTRSPWDGGGGGAVGSFMNRGGNAAASSGDERDQPPEMGAPRFELTEAPQVQSEVVVPIIQNVSVANTTNIEGATIHETQNMDNQETGE